MSLRKCLSFLFSLSLFYNTWSQSKQASVIDEAISLYQAGSSVSAIVLLENEIEKSPKAEYYELKSQIEVEVGMLRAALRSVSKALELSLDRWDLHFRRGLIFHNLGIYKKAIDDFSDFIRHNDGATTAIFFRSDINEQEPLRIKTSNMVVTDAFMYRGLSYQAIDSLSRAEHDLISAIKLDSSAALFLNLGLIQLEKGDTLLARDALKTAVTLNSNYALGWYNLKLIDRSVTIPIVIAEDSQIFPLLQYRALEALEQNNLHLAGQLKESLIRLFPDRAENLELAGRIAYKQGDFSSAILYFLEGQKLATENGVFHNLLGNSYFQLGEYEAAVSHYEMQLISDPFNVAVGFNAAVAYHRLGDTDNMCRCIRNLQKSEFDNPQLIKLLNQCQSAGN